MSNTTVTTNKWVFSFATEDGSSTTMSFKYADISADATDIAFAVSTLISNGDIFTKVPTMLKTAKLVTQVETTYDIDPDEPTP